MRNNEKKKLYRKVNTRTHNVHHFFGGDYKNTRRRDSAIGMRQGVRRGLDYTPLFKFLLSKVGDKWSDVHSEAVSRLDQEEPIFWMVAKDFDSAEEYVRIGDNSYYSGLFINDHGILCIVNPELTEDSLKPSCSCCTHTLNGIQFTQKYD
ncbi:hypothetical protein MSP8887_02083 [Marinomonas spartinae]|uniref:hypothetical protein n=1 Tax=Marinomonas spartinae TaxID=1792290 RepID=UPI000808E709|nr:hypothetical protein [Marinomonas spartinae]SBS34064.1 hypothetical protein MSP8887_02083 [Marinomonas spartinae]